MVCMLADKTLHPGGQVDLVQHWLGVWLGSVLEFGMSVPAQDDAMLCICWTCSFYSAGERSHESFVISAVSPLLGSVFNDVSRPPTSCAFV